MSVEIELAQSLSHALELLAAKDPLVRPVCGATDVMLRLEHGRLQARRLVSISDLTELSWVRAEEGRIGFGAGTKVTDLLLHPEVRRALPAFAKAAGEFASPQIRNLATVGGNIGNASPAADLVPPLIALGATATLQSAKASRTLPVEDLFLGMGKTAIGPDELVTELWVPRPEGAFQTFTKFGHRGANVIAVVNMAMCLSLAGGAVRSARVAYGSVAPKPLRATGVERALVGQPLSALTAERVRAAVLADINPIDDVRGSKRYKELLAVHATQDALALAQGAAA